MSFNLLYEIIEAINSPVYEPVIDGEAVCSKEGELRLLPQSTADFSEGERVLVF